VIVGDIGYGENVAFTALGDAVNVAARLQDMSKELECEVVISDEVYQTAGLPHGRLQLKEITVRGRAAPIVVRTVVNAEISRHYSSGLWPIQWRQHKTTAREKV
jgi:adenylate cyclase